MEQEQPPEFVMEVTDKTRADVKVRLYSISFSLFMIYIVIYTVMGTFLEATIIMLKTRI